MVADRIQRQIFREGSTTFFNSSLFFPPNVRRDVFTLYCFVRTADDFVDTIPQRADDFYYFRENYCNALNGHPANNPVIDQFIELMGRKGFAPQWVESFLDTMELDLTKKSYSSIEEIIEYMYGSAEVIGLFMMRIMDLPPGASRYARMQGRAMQYINIIRDIEEDRQLGRTYLPLGDSKITILDYEHALFEPEAFIHFMHVQLCRYREWQSEARKGFIFLPLRYLIPIKTATDMYNWTARKIELNPFIVFSQKVKPSQKQ
ncbi:MAG: phytoene/squalene synthase family protein, partial [Dehalococcoidia bacterium]